MDSVEEEVGTEIGRDLKDLKNDFYAKASDTFYIFGYTLMIVIKSYQS
jgi:hypothetical protein